MQAVSRPPGATRRLCRRVQHLTAACPSLNPHTQRTTFALPSRSLTPSLQAAATVMCNFGLLQSLHSQWQTPGGARTPAAATPDDSDTEGEAGGGGGGGGPAGRRGGGGDEEGAALCERLLRWAGQPHVEREAPLLCRLVQLVAQQVLGGAKGVCIRVWSGKDAG